MTFSQFTAHLAANAKHIPAAIAAEVRRDAKARVTARWQAGRADSELDFSDLIIRIENAVCS